VQRGEVLVEAGMPTARFFVVTAGQIGIVRLSGATEELIAIYGPGMFTGEVTRVLTTFIGKPPLSLG
jgi:CRP-like cAMP-binding protein